MSDPANVPRPGDIPRRLYYVWRRQPAPASQQRREALIFESKAIQHEVKASYGSPGIYDELAARGWPCSVNSVARLISRSGGAAKNGRKFRCTTDSNNDQPIAENTVDRQFGPATANQTWTANITSILAQEGWLELAAEEDLH